MAEAGRKRPRDISDENTGLLLQILLALLADGGGADADADADAAAPLTLEGSVDDAAPRAPIAAAAAVAALEPFHGPAADSRLGELLIDVLPFACGVGYALDLHHARWLCSTTWRRGVWRTDGVFDRAGFLGGTADMIASSGRLQGYDAMWATRRKFFPPTQLMRELRKGDVARVRNLVAAGAKLHPVNAGRWTALHFACAHGHALIAKLLLLGKFEGQGANINAQNVHGDSPLSMACFFGHADVVHVLLEHNADACLVNNDGDSPLKKALARSRFRIVEILMAHIKALKRREEAST